MQPRKASSLCLLTFLAVALAVPAPAQAQIATTDSFDPAIIGSTVTGVTGSSNTRDVTVNRTSGTGEFRLRAARLILSS